MAENCKVCGHDPDRERPQCSLCLQVGRFPVEPSDCYRVAMDHIEEALRQVEEAIELFGKAGEMAQCDEYTAVQIRSELADILAGESERK